METIDAKIYMGKPKEGNGTSLNPKRYIVMEKGMKGYGLIEEYRNHEIKGNDLSRLVETLLENHKKEIFDQITKIRSGK